MTTFVSMAPKTADTAKKMNDFGDPLEKQEHRTDGGFGRSRHNNCPVIRPFAETEHLVDAERFVYFFVITN